MARKNQTVSEVEIIRNRRVEITRPEGAATTGHCAPAVDLMARLALAKKMNRRAVRRERTIPTQYFRVQVLTRNSRRSGRVIATSARQAVEKYLDRDCGLVRNTLHIRAEAIHEKTGLVTLKQAIRESGEYFASRGKDSVWSVRNTDTTAESAEF